METVCVIFHEMACELAMDRRKYHGYSTDKILKESSHGVSIISDGTYLALLALHHHFKEQQVSV